MGNSLTYTNDLPAMVAAMGMSPGSPRPIQAKGLTIPRATLEQLWRVGSGAKAVQEGHWDFVILQERGTWPLRDPENMYVYARLFDAEIRKSGAKTVFFITWAPLDREETQPVVDRVYRKIAGELNAMIAPVGPAWAEARKLDPKINLYNGDRYSHPTVAGSYLAACVVYLVIMDRQACPAMAPSFDIQADEIEVARKAASLAAANSR